MQSFVPVELAANGPGWGSGPGFIGAIVAVIATPTSLVKPGASMGSAEDREASGMDRPLEAGVSP